MRLRRLRRLRRLMRCFVVFSLCCCCSRGVGPQWTLTVKEEREGRHTTVALQDVVMWDSSLVNYVSSTEYPTLQFMYFGVVAAAAVFSPTQL